MEELSVVYTSLQLVFKRHAHDRTIKFTTISEAAGVPMTEVGGSLALLYVQWGHKLELVRWLNKCLVEVLHA